MDNFNKTDDLYDPNFSINSKSTEKLDMYGVWLKKKKDINEPLDSDDSQFTSNSDIGSEQDSTHHLVCRYLFSGYGCRYGNTRT